MNDNACGQKPTLTLPWTTRWPPAARTASTQTALDLLGLATLSITVVRPSDFSTAHDVRAVGRAGLEIRGNQYPGFDLPHRAERHISPLASCSRPLVILLS
jgi:hypothetical protein